MKIVYHLLCLFLLFTSNIQASESALRVSASAASDTSDDAVIREEVRDIAAIEQHITREGKGVFLFDADEVLFTFAVSEDGTAAKLVRLYPTLEALIRNIKSREHQAFIITYNHKTAIQKKLSEIDLDAALFDGIIACEMEGDVKTAKGELFRKHLTESEVGFDFAVFIDNFVPFVDDIERVAREIKIPLFSFVFTGYLDFYRKYVYYYLKTLHIDCKDGKDVADKLAPINKSLVKYGINISTFLEDFSDFDAFSRVTADLTWPYLIYW